MGLSRGIRSLLGMVLMSIVLSLPTPSAPADDIRQLKKLFIDTVLVRDGGPQAEIFYPDTPAYREAALELQAKLKETLTQLG